MTQFDRSRIATPDHPKSVVFAQLHNTLANYYAVMQTDKRAVSPQYLAFEARYKMNSSGPDAPSCKTQQQNLEYVNKIRASSTSTYTMPTPAYVSIEPITLHNVQCYWITLPSTPSWKQNNFIVHYHGGCNIFGSIYTHSGMSATLCKHFNMPVLFVDYKLAPEHPFPSQRNEAVAVHKALLELDNTCYKRMITFGESAGGNLSIIHNQAVIAEKLPAPQLCISISPMSDSTCSGDAYTSNAQTEIMMSKQQAQWYFEQCVGGKDNISQLKDTPMNPLNGTFKGFPATIISTGAAEILLSDSEMLHQRMQQDGVDVTLSTKEHMPHNFTVYTNQFPESADEMEKIVAWTRQKLQHTN